MSDFRARMYEEHARLYDRIEKLKTFIVSARYDELPEIERAALKEQLRHMQGYFATCKAISMSWISEYRGS